MQPQTALVLDDNDDAGRICELGLSHIGYDVKVLHDSRAGLDLLQQETFDLLILDLRMPGVGGITVLQKVRAMPIHDAMRIVILSGDVHQASQLVERASYVLPKPIDLASFLNIAKAG